MGRYLMTEHDLLEKTLFPDEIAYGGWFIDIHTTGGLLGDSALGKSPPTGQHLGRVAMHMAIFLDQIEHTRPDWVLLVE